MRAPISVTSFASNAAVGARRDISDLNVKQLKVNLFDQRESLRTGARGQAKQNTKGNESCNVPNEKHAEDEDGACRSCCDDQVIDS
jgi:hypothetical protein